MANTFRVVLDACVMLPQNLNNLLLTLADDDLFTPVWSADLLFEVERNLVQKISDKLTEAGYEVIILRGGMKAADRQKILTQLAEYSPEDPPLLVVGTSSFVGEGFDCPALDTLFLAAPIISPRRRNACSNLPSRWPLGSTRVVEGLLGRLSSPV